MDAIRGEDAEPVWSLPASVLVAEWPAEDGAMLLLQLARSLEPAILARGWQSPEEFQKALAACEQAMERPECSVRTFRLVQAWGRTELTIPTGPREFSKPPN